MQFRFKVVINIKVSKVVKAGANVKYNTVRMIAYTVDSCITAQLNIVLINIGFISVIFQLATTEFIKTELQLVFLLTVFNSLIIYFYQKMS